MTTPDRIHANMDQLEPRRLMSAAGADASPADAPHSPSPLDPRLVLAFADPAAVDPTEWRELSRRHVLPKAGNGPAVAAAAESAAQSIHIAGGEDAAGVRVDTTPKRQHGLSPDRFQVFDHVWESAAARPAVQYGDLGVERPYAPGFRAYLQDSPDGKRHWDVNEAALRAQVDLTAPGGTFIFNVEHWPIDIRTESKADVDETMAKWGRILDIARDQRPDVQFGVYGEFPLRDYWTTTNYAQAVEAVEAGRGREDHFARNIEKFTARYEEWQEANAYLAPIAERFDMVMPSLYTFYADRASWERYAEHQIAAAAKYGKPVNAYIWMRYHESNAQLGNQLVEPDFFRRQLEFVRERAAGVTIFGSSSKLSPHDGWMRELGDFLRDRRDGLWADARPDDSLFA